LNIFTAPEYPIKTKKIILTTIFKKNNKLTATIDHHGRNSFPKQSKYKRIYEW
jgi:hypothetical protein